MTESNKFFKNITSNYFIYGAKLFIGIYSLPVCLNLYGTELYGLYLICFGLSSAMAAFDFGSSRSVFRYTVEYNSDRNKTKFSEAINTAFSFNFYASLIITICLVVVGQFSATIFNLSDNVAAVSKLMFFIGAINAFITTLDAVPQNIITANKLFHKRNLYQAILVLLNFGVIIAAQVYELSIQLFAVLTTAITALVFLTDTFIVFQYKLIKDIKIRLLSFKKLLHSPFSGYSLQVFLHSVVSFMAIQADRLIIGAVLDPSAVTIYTIITKPYIVLRGITAITFPVLQPSLTKLFIDDIKINYARFSAKIVRIGLFLMINITLLVALFYDDILLLWLGTAEYYQYLIWGVLSLVTLSITMLYQPYFRTLLHSNKIISLLKFSMFSVTGNVLISILLTHYLGFQGVLIGTFIQILSELVFSYFLIGKIINPFKLAILKPGYLVSCILIICLGILGFYFLNGISINLFQTILIFSMVTSVLGLATYLLIKKESIKSELNNVNTQNSIITE